MQNLVICIWNILLHIILITGLTASEKILRIYPTHGISSAPNVYLAIWDLQWTTITQASNGENHYPGLQWGEPTTLASNVENSLPWPVDNPLPPSPMWRTITLAYNVEMNLLPWPLMGRTHHTTISNVENHYPGLWCEGMWTTITVASNVENHYFHFQWGELLPRPRMWRSITLA
jgi:hypothetical protein